MIYDKLSKYYDQFLDLDLYDDYYKLIKKHIKKGNVIDLGTGTGILAIKLAKDNFFVTATDISTRMLETAYNNALIEKVDIRFFIHDILEQLNQPYDLIVMSSDVINYLDSETDVKKAFKNINDVMTKNSIFIFDFLRPAYLNSLDDYQESIELEDTILKWSINKTEVINQVKHTLMLDDDIETHIQTTYDLKKYKELLNSQNLKVVKAKTLDERIILVCERKSN
jgi:2-polyprenyl-3-methyl-5-hydroxy-6-metoxy-1,4-benzoquinol methylase